MNFFIGGLGGSGTRIISSVYKDHGVYFGANLNNALDNLAFTLLFRDINPIKDKRLFDRRFKLFLNYSKKQSSLVEIFKWPFFANRGQFSNKARLLILFNFLKYSLRKKNSLNAGFLKAFKEPNSIHYVENILNTSFLKFIFFVRNPLNMALSTNKRQLNTFGNYYQINEKDDFFSQIAYFLKTYNNISKLKIKYPSRIFEVRFEEFCLQTQSEFNRINSFLGIKLKFDSAKLSREPFLAENKYTKKRYRKIKKIKIF